VPTTIAIAIVVGTLEWLRSYFTEVEQSLRQR
jgi:hypothetical protein